MCAASPSGTSPRLLGVGRRYREASGQSTATVPQPITATAWVKPIDAMSMTHSGAKTDAPDTRAVERMTECQRSPPFEPRRNHRNDGGSAGRGPPRTT